MPSPMVMIVDLPPLIASSLTKPSLLYYDTNLMETNDIFDKLFNVLYQRKMAGADETSYVAGLIIKGTGKINRKIMEEAYEVCEAALQADRQHLTTEICDLLFHTFIQAVNHGVSLQQIRTELTRRFGTSGLTEKARRNIT